MKTKFLTFLAMAIMPFAFSQVGVNTSNPMSTLDVTAKNMTGTTSNVDGLLLPRVDRQRAQSMTGVTTSTIIYVNSVATGSQAGTAVNIDDVGFYSFNGTEWVKLGANPSGSFTPYVAVAGRSTTSMTQAGSSGFLTWSFTASLNDGNWDNSTSQYTVPKAGFYQLSMQGLVRPSTGTNAYTWQVIYGSGSFDFGNFNNLQANNFYNKGGSIVLYLEVGQTIRFGGTPCFGSGCTSSYNISTRTFAIQYLGNN